VDSARSRFGRAQTSSVSRRVALGIALAYALLGSIWVFTTDRLLPALGATPEEMVRLGTYKGLAYVVLTSALFYAALRLAPRVFEPESLGRSRGWHLAVTFLVLAAAILATGYQAHQFNLRNFEARYQDALRVVAQTKAQRVGEWVGHQFQAMQATGQLHSIRVRVEHAFAGRDSALDDLRADLARMGGALGVDAMLLTDQAGNPLLATGQAVAPELVAEAIRAAGAGGVGIALSDGGPESAALVAFAHPLPSSDGEDVNPAFVVSVADLRNYLVPLVETWSLSDSAGEAVLARMGPGGELRIVPGFSTTLMGSRVIKFPLDKLPGDRAATSRRLASGVFQGYTVGGQPVMLAFARVPGVDWVVATAMDRGGLFAGMTSLGRNTALVMLVALVIAAWLILALFRQQQAAGRAMLDSALRERDALDRHFSYLTRFANDIVLMLDSEGRIVNFNDRAMSAYGYPREELLGKSVFELRPAALRDAARRQLDQIRSQGSLVYETRHRRKDGTDFPVEVSARGFAVEGETFVQSIIRDTSDRKQAEEELRDSEARYRNLFEQTAVGMAHISPEGRLLQVNQRMADQLGYAREELEQMMIEQISVPEDLPREYALFDAMLTGRQDSGSVEMEYRRKDGSVVWGHATFSAVRDEAGRIRHFIGAMQDIGARKQLEAQLRRRNRLYRALSETNRAIARAEDAAALLREACGIAVTETSLVTAAVIQEPADSAAKEVLAAAGPASAELATFICAQGVPAGGAHVAAGCEGVTTDDSGPAGAMVVNDVESGPVSADLRLACLRRGVRAYACWLLEVPGWPRTLFVACAAETGFFGDDTLGSLGRMARDLAGALRRFAERAAREQAEQRLQAMAQRMKGLIEAAPIAILDLDAAGRVIDVWNPAAERLTGWRRDEVLGQRVPVLPESAAEQAYLDSLIAKVLQGQSFAGIELQRVHRDGSPFQLSIAVAPVPGRDGEMSALVMAEDISARHAAAEMLRRARDELELRVRERTAELAAALDRAEEADHIKTAFLSNMSHELRTPVNTIIGFSSLLLSGGPGTLNEEQGKQLDIIRGAGERLASLIDDVLDIARLQSADARLPCEPVPLRDMLLRVAGAFRPQAAARGLSLETEVGSCMVMAEPRRLEQVLGNLVGNAVKYTDEGKVTLGCRCEGEVVEIAVSDSGIGIAPKDLDRLFVPFGQVDRAQAGRQGAGLGLAIARRLVEAMGGSIQVESEPGRGSRFTVVLPAVGG
jgi:PAS domain S-box-containing protein